jgi:signal transduction histidine kinase
LTGLFEPFEQVLDAGASALQGLGLGLPICRGFIQQHEGKIDGSSEGLGPANG